MCICEQSPQLEVIIATIANQKVVIATRTNQKVVIATITNQKVVIAAITNQKVVIATKNNQKVVIATITNQKGSHSYNNQSEGGLYSSLIVLSPHHLYLQCIIYQANQTIRIDTL